MAISHFLKIITVVRLITVCKNGRQKFKRTVPLSEQSRGPYAREHGNSNVISGSARGARSKHRAEDFVGAGAHWG